MCNCYRRVALGVFRNFAWLLYIDIKSLGLGNGGYKQILCGAGWGAGIFLLPLWSLWADPKQVTVCTYIYIYDLFTYLVVDLFMYLFIYLFICIQLEKLRIGQHREQAPLEKHFVACCVSLGLFQYYGGGCSFGTILILPSHLSCSDCKKACDGAQNLLLKMQLQLNVV